MKNYILPLSSLLLTLPTAGLFGTTYTNSEVNTETLITAGTLSSHTINILDGYAFSSTYLYIGSANSYIDLSILNAGSVTSQYGYLGYGSTSDTSAGSNNSVTITGAGSTWTNSEDLYLGIFGSSNTLSISDGAVISNATGHIGYGDTSYTSAGCNNNVTITGTGSEDITTKWTNSKYLSVGYSGSSNSLSISAGADVTNADGFIGYNFTSGNNRVTITGTGSNDTSTKWTSSGDLFVGYFGSSNTLSISDGADVSDVTGYIGCGYYKNASYGCGNGATITGTGSTWTNSGNLNVGDYGSNNTFSISDGAVVTNTNGYIGGQTTGDSNSVAITGKGSNDTSTKWTNSGELTIGYLGSSNTLSISAGADVTNTNGYIGSQSASNSNSVAITGAGSIWINSGSLTIGQTTNTGNTLTIDNGALVKVGDALGEVLTINVDSDSLNYVKLGRGYLALYGDVTTTSGDSTITALLSGIEVYNSATDTWSVVTNASQLSIIYYTTAEEALAEAATGYSGLAGYTVITLATVPEPATYALFGGIGALALVLIRRKKQV